MEIILVLIAVFTISFLLIFRMVYKGERLNEDGEKGSLWMITFVTFLLALIPAVVVGLMILVLLGSLNVANTIFSLHISIKQLVLLAVIFFVYLFTVDSVVEEVFKYMMGENLFHLLTNMLIRLVAFGLVGVWVGLNSTDALLISIGTAFIILIIEISYGLRQKALPK